MRLVIVAVEDVKAEAYMNPVPFQSKGQAVRSFADGVNGGDANGMAKHPEDYRLWFIGSFDPQSGKLYAEEKVCLGNGADFVAHVDIPRKE